MRNINNHNQSTALTLPCLDRPVENALGLVKTGGNNREAIIEFWPLTI